MGKRSGAYKFEKRRKEIEKKKKKEEKRARKLDKSQGESDDSSLDDLLQEPSAEPVPPDTA